MEDGKVVDCIEGGGGLVNCMRGEVMVWYSAWERSIDKRNMYPHK